MQSWQMNYSGSRDGVKKAVREHVVVPMSRSAGLPVPPAGEAALAVDPPQLDPDVATFIEAMKNMVVDFIDRAPSHLNGVSVTLYAIGTSVVKLNIESIDLKL